MCNHCGCDVSLVVSLHSTADHCGFDAPLLLLSCNVDDRWTMHDLWHGPPPPCMDTPLYAILASSRSFAVGTRDKRSAEIYGFLDSSMHDHTVALYSLHVVAIHLHQFKTSTTVQEHSINLGSLSPSSHGDLVRNVLMSTGAVLPSRSSA
jgi:hypothetical protein